jgi:hypothetical protein
MKSLLSQVDFLLLETILLYIKVLQFEESKKMNSMKRYRMNKSNAIDDSILERRLYKETSW